MKYNIGLKKKLIKKKRIGNYKKETGGGFAPPVWISTCVLSSNHRSFSVKQSREEVEQVVLAENRDRDQRNRAHDFDQDIERRTYGIF